MIDECPMTEECPGYDRGLQVCLLRPDDCEFAPAALNALGARAARPPEASEPLAADADRTQVSDPRLP